MSNVKRVYVEKKPEFAVAAKGLRHEIRHYLGLQDDKCTSSDSLRRREYFRRNI